MSPITNSFRTGPSMSLDFEGIAATNQLLLDAAARGEDMRPAMERVKLLFIEGHRENFESRGALFGQPWPPLSPETVARKAREGIPALNDIMVGSGDLRESLSGGRGSRTRVSKGSVSVGTKYFYAIFALAGASGKGEHSKGSRAGRRGQEPARPVVGITPAEREESLSIITDYLLGRP